MSKWAAAILASMVAIGIGSHLSAQSMNTTLVAFDVVSIKPADPNAPLGGSQITAEGYRQSAAPLIKAIVMAYLPDDGLSIDRVKNVPAWVADERYDIVAKVAAEDVAAWGAARQTRIKKPLVEKLLQAALAERCGLKVHETPVDVPALALIGGKHELKLTPSKPEEPNPTGWQPIPGGGAAHGPARGDVVRVTKFHATSMADLAAYLTLFGGGVPVLNQTGIEGRFDFEVPLFPNDPQAPFTPGDGTLPWDVKAIGLDLMRTKTVQTAITIDAIHKPTAN